MEAENQACCHHLFCPDISSASDPYGRCQPQPAQQWCTQHKDMWFECQVSKPATKQHTCMLREFGENNEFFFTSDSVSKVWWEPCTGQIFWIHLLTYPLKLVHPKGHGLNWWNLIHQDTNVTRIQNSKKLRTKQKRSDLLARFPSVIPMLFVFQAFSQFQQCSEAVWWIRQSQSPFLPSALGLSYRSLSCATLHCKLTGFFLQMSISWQPWSSTSETPTPPCFPAQCLGRPEHCSTPTELPIPKTQWVSFKIHVFVGN